MGNYLEYKLLRHAECNRKSGFKFVMIEIADYSSGLSYNFKHKDLCLFGYNTHEYDPLSYYNITGVLYRILHGPIFVIRGHHLNDEDIFSQLPYSIFMSEVI
jgi:hypothetical protein